MATLKKYVAKKRSKVVSRAAVTAQSPLAHEDVRQGKRSRARELYHVFVVVQRQHGKWVLPYGADRRAVTCFHKLARQFEAL